MRIPGLQSSILTPEERYHRLGRLIENAPGAPTSGGPLSSDVTLSSDMMSWIGSANAVIGEIGDLGLSTEFGNAANALHYPDRAATAYQKMLLILHKALGIAELEAPVSARGAFIPVGNTFDAFAAIAKIFGSARSDILIVDPYMDATVITDFAGSAPANVRLRLLTDAGSVRPDLEPAAKRWKQQNTTRALELRLAPARRLHDRVILVDGTDSWAVTQSLKDLAKRSPAEILRAADTAALKIAAYEAEWTSATVIV